MGIANTLVTAVASSCAVQYAVKAGRIPRDGNGMIDSEVADRVA
jgi:hypothetical protein